MVTVKAGAIKYSSLKAAYEAAKKRNPKLKYITFYARVKAKENKLGLGWSTNAAMLKKVRAYNKRSEITV